MRSGGTPSKTNEGYWSGDIPWVSSGEMAERRIYDTELKITEEAARKGSRLVPAGTVLFVVRGMSLAKEFRVALTMRQVAFNQDLKALECADDIDPGFLFYALLARKEYIRDLATEASHGTKKLESAVLDSVEIPIPARDEQERVSSFFAAYDDLIDNNRRRIQLLEDSVRLLFDEWFVRLRFPGHAPSSSTGGMPNGWSKIALDQMLLLQRGFDLPSQDREAGDVPIYGSTGIVGFHNKAKVKGPGLVTGRSGSLGEVHFVAQDFWPLNTALWVKEFKRATPLFALHLLRNMNLEQYNGGVSVPTLDRKVVHKAEVLLPAASIMTRFESVAFDVYRQSNTLTEMNLKLRTARDLLLPRLMSGELTV